MKVFLIDFLCIIVILTSGCSFCSKPRQGKHVNEVWEANNKTFKVRVTAYAEESGGIIAGAYFVFRSSRLDSDDWKDIMTYRNDDPIKIPKEQIRFVSDNIGYVFMGWMYAVTVDSGDSWSVWNAATDIPNWSSQLLYIKDIKIEKEGNGTMTLISAITTKPIEFYTNDYGKYWNAEDVRN